jgi:hypothetical protein
VLLFRHNRLQNYTVTITLTKRRLLSVCHQFGTKHDRPRSASGDSNPTTIPVVVAGFVLVIRFDLQSFLILCGAYIAFLGVFTVLCIMSVPKDHRKRPQMPDEFREVRSGEVSQSVANLLETGMLLEIKELNDGSHRLFCVERSFETGMWSCLIEECSGKILAYSTIFHSAFTPALDCGKSYGSGAFFASGS